MIFINYIDLHLHTDYSDGTLSPTELVKLCYEKNIKTISITDHDTLKGLKEAKSIAKEFNINLINGVEMSAMFQGENIHILCYGFDYRSNLLQEFLDTKAIEMRNIRNKKIMEKLNNLGITISNNDLIERNSSTIITRAHFSTFLINKGVVKDRHEAFDKYLNKDGLAYVPKVLPDVEEVTDLIKKIGGITSLAHPNLYKFFHNNFFEKLKLLKSLGLNGVECYHSTYNSNITTMLLSYCNELDMVATGGSDFHGDNKKDVFLGQCTDNNFLKEEKLANFLKLNLSTI